MIKEKIEVEVKKLLEIGTKKGSLNEEDIMFRLLKYEASAEEIEKVMDTLEESNIKSSKQVTLMWKKKIFQNWFHK